MAIFEGAGVALVTPFKENGTVNYEVLESLIRKQMTITRPTPRSFPRERPPFTANSLP